MANKLHFETEIRWNHLKTSYQLKIPQRGNKTVEYIRDQNLMNNQQYQVISVSIGKNTSETQIWVDDNVKPYVSSFLGFYIEGETISCYFLPRHFPWRKVEKQGIQQANITIKTQLDETECSVRIVIKSGGDAKNCFLAFDIGAFGNSSTGCWWLDHEMIDVNADCFSYKDTKAIIINEGDKIPPYYSNQREATLYNITHLNKIPGLWLGKSSYDLFQEKMKDYFAKRLVEKNVDILKYILDVDIYEYAKLHLRPDKPQRLLQSNKQVKDQEGLLAVDTDSIWQEVLFQHISQGLADLVESGILPMNGTLSNAEELRTFLKDKCKKIYFSYPTRMTDDYFLYWRKKILDYPMFNDEDVRKKIDFSMDEGTASFFYFLAANNFQEIYKSIMDEKLEKKTENFLVVDVGGGSTDINGSEVSYQPDLSHGQMKIIVTRKVTEGHPEIGGRLFTAKIAWVLIRRLDAQTGDESLLDIILSNHLCCEKGEPINNYDQTCLHEPLKKYKVLPMEDMPFLIDHSLILKDFPTQQDQNIGNSNFQNICQAAEAIKSYEPIDSTVPYYAHFMIHTATRVLFFLTINSTPDTQSFLDQFLALPENGDSLNVTLTEWHYKTIELSDSILLRYLRLEKQELSRLLEETHNISKKEFKCNGTKMSEIYHKIKIVGNGARFRVIRKVLDGYFDMNSYVPASHRTSVVTGLLEKEILSQLRGEFIFTLPGRDTTAKNTIFYANERFDRVIFPEGTKRNLGQFFAEVVSESEVQEALKICVEDRYALCNFRQRQADYARILQHSRKTGYNDISASYSDTVKMYFPDKPKDPLPYQLFGNSCFPLIAYFLYMPHNCADGLKQVCPNSLREYLSGLPVNNVKSPWNDWNTSISPEILDKIEENQEAFFYLLDFLYCTYIANQLPDITDKYRKTLSNKVADSSTKLYLRRFFQTYEKEFLVLFSPLEASGLTQTISRYELHLPIILEAHSREYSKLF